MRLSAARRNIRERPSRDRIPRRQQHPHVFVLCGLTDDELERKLAKLSPREAITDDDLIIPVTAMYA
jgi:hypothetical protein